MSPGLTRGLVQHTRPPHPGRARTDPLDCGLVAEWRFNPPTGLMLPDYTGYNYRLDVATGTPVWTTGRYGPAVDFDGSSGFDNTTFARTDSEGTIEVFVAGDASQDGIILVIPQGDYANYFRLGFGANAKVRLAITLNDDGGTPYNIYYITALDWGLFLHIIFTVDSSGNKLHINGSQVTPGYSSGSASNTEWLDDVSPDKIRVGAAAGFTSLNGKIGLIRLYKRALCGGEAHKRYQLCLQRQQRIPFIWPLPWARSPIPVTRRIFITHT